jgi:hypothetical protein
MVSTWDGDKLSLIRVHHQLRAARKLDVAKLGDELGRALAPLTEQAGLEVRGIGVHRVVDARDKAESLRRRLAEHGIRVRRFPNDHIAMTLAVDASKASVEHLRAAIVQVVS